MTASAVEVTRTMAVTERTATLPASLRALLARFDVRAFPVRVPELRVRLDVAGERGWDLLVRRGRPEIRTAQLARFPDATLTADAASWGRIAGDPGGAIDAFREGRVTVRRNSNAGARRRRRSPPSSAAPKRPRPSAGR
jgi:hypothetical protein